MKANVDVGKRLQILRERTELNPRQYALSNGFDVSVYARVEKGKTGLPEHYLKTILDKQGINLNWLITGEGEMFARSYPEGEQESFSGNIDGGKSIYMYAPPSKVTRRAGEGDVPYYDADFEAGLGIDFYDDIRSEKPTYVMHIPDFAGCTAFPTYGRSFYPVIEPGALLFATEEKNWQDGVEYGQIFGIVLHPVDGVRKRYLKRVRKSGRPDTHFLLQSANPDYDDFELAKDKIKSMWLIHGWLNKNT